MKINKLAFSFYKLSITLYVTYEITKLFYVSCVHYMIFRNHDLLRLKFISRR